MERTQLRPLPHGDLDSSNALFFALSLAVISILILVFWVNLLTALLTFISLIGYAVIYTMFLKRSTPQNIVLGGVAAPPLLGWTAMTGEIQSEALLLFLIIFIWTPPHFWALAIRRREEYAKAGIPMFPVTDGLPFTKLQILLYCPVSRCDAVAIHYPDEWFNLFGRCDSVRYRIFTLCHSLVPF
ncbi:MAG: UbiA family prenyltransferase [Candidatus Parabeggiatoa sp.]|nr:UbiA family prenyltransferase [Candidatus Parabeggiatoa sp.]